MHDDFFENIEDTISEGYRLIDEMKFIEAVDVWYQAWQQFKLLLKMNNVITCEAMDELCADYPSAASSWIEDFTTELYSAGLKDKSYFTKQIEVSEELLILFVDEEQVWINGVKRDIATAWFGLGKQEYTDQLFEKLLQTNPRWGWGWIRWSDCYWITEKEGIDYKRGEEILQRALEIEELEDKSDVLDRLFELYHESGRPDKAAELYQKYESIENSNEFKIAGLLQMLEEKNQTFETLELENSRLRQERGIKIGRNQPCPCGSGKKYKKCCME